MEKQDTGNRAPTSGVSVQATASHLKVWQWHWLNGSLHEFDADRVSGKCVWISRRRQLLHATDRFFLSREEAIEHRSQQLSKRLEFAHRGLSEAQLALTKFQQRYGGSTQDEVNEGPKVREEQK